MRVMLTSLFRGSLAALSTAATGTGAAGRTTSPAPGAAASGTAWRAVGPSFGVDRLRWPATVAKAAVLLKLLPSRLNSQNRGTYVSPPEEEFGASAVADYGDYASVSVSELGRAATSAAGK